jgi:hypothetical protein
MKLFEITKYWRRNGSIIGYYAYSKHSYTSNEACDSAKRGVFSLKLVLPGNELS